MKLIPRKFPHLVQNRENICTRKLWRIKYLPKLYNSFKGLFPKLTYNIATLPIVALNPVNSTD